MADENIKQVMQDAILDADSLERFINGSDSETVLTRLSAEYPTLQKAIKELFESGGLPATPFTIKALMEASELVDGDYALVTDDTEPNNNGLYVKTSGEWARSSYDFKSLTQDVTSQSVVSGIKNYEDLVFENTGNVFSKLNSEKSYIDASGTVLPSIDYALTDFIAVEANQDYIYLSSTTLSSGLFYRVGYYDYNKKLIAVNEVRQEADYVLTGEQAAIFPNGYTAKITKTPSNALYVRAMYRDRPEDRQHDSYIYKSGFVGLPNNSRTLKAVEFSNYNKARSSINVRDIISDDLLDSSRNLFDYNDTDIGYYISGTGEVGVGTGYSVSGFISVEPDTIYSQSHKREEGQTTTTPFIHTAFFDASKKFLYRITNKDDTFRTPSNAHFIRVNTNAGLPSEHFRMLSRTDNPVAYEPFSRKIKSELLPAGDSVVINANNLFDYTDTSLPFNTIILETGEVVLSVNYSTSGFIPVVEGKSYTVSSDSAERRGFMYVALYDSNREFLERLSVDGAIYSSQGFYTITIPEGASYVRLSYNAGRGHVHNRMFNEGSAPLPYDNGVHKLGRYSFSEDMKDVVLKDTGYRLKERSYTDMPFDGVYHSTQSDEELTQFSGWYDNTHTDVHNLYEALRDKYPNYIKKKQYGLDDWGNEFLAYTFTPERQPAETYPKLAKIYINCSIHGHEHAPALSTYLMMQQICDNWTSDPLLEALRFNVEFVIVPVANMGGYDDRTNKNRNNVNLNRSFPYGFGAGGIVDPSQDKYGGEEPFQEKETQYMAQVFDDHPDMDACFDYHCFGSGSIWRYMWTPTCDDHQFERLSYKWQNRMSHKWAKDFDFLPKDEIIPLGRIDYSRSAGMLAGYAFYDRGVEIASIVEVARVWNLESGLTMYDATHCRTLTEAITNLVLITADTLTKP